MAKTRGDKVCEKLAICRHDQLEEVAATCFEREPELSIKLHRLLGELIDAKAALAVDAISCALPEGYPSDPGRFVPGSSYDPVGVEDPEDEVRA